MKPNKKQIDEELVEGEENQTEEVVVEVKPAFLGLKKLDISPEKRRALESAAKQLGKQYKNKTVIARCGDYEFEKAERVPTIYPQVNYAFGGGTPRGRLIEIFGEESSGKSLLSAHIVSQFQARKLVALWVDLERTMDPTFYRLHGVDMENLLLSTPDSAEECFNTVRTMVETGAIDIIVVDSVAALVTESELERTAEEMTIGTTAKLMSQELKKLVPIAAANNCTIIFINQTRDKIGVMFGDPKTTPGGKALRFYSSLRMEVRKLTGADNVYKDGTGDQVGHNVSIRMVKNKTAPPFRTAQFPIFYDGRKQEPGIIVKSLLDLAEKLDVVQVVKNTYRFVYTTPEGPKELTGLKTAFSNLIAKDKDAYKAFGTAISMKAIQAPNKFEIEAAKIQEKEYEEQEDGSVESDNS